MSTFSRTKKWTMNDQRGLSVCCWDGSCTYWLFYRVKRDASSAWKFSALRDKIIAKFSLRKAFISTWTNISITSSRTGRIINFAPFYFVIHNDFETPLFQNDVHMIQQDHIWTSFPPSLMLSKCVSKQIVRLCSRICNHHCLYWGLSIMKWCNECAYRNHFS